MAQPSAEISSFPVSDENPRSTAVVVTSGNLLSEDRDPTRELRNLIEQLQDAARDARARQRMAEEERDHAMDELTRSQTDISAARDIEKKIKTLQRERDTLAEQHEKYSSIVAELKQKLEGADRQRLDALRQRDEKTKLYGDTSKQLKDSLASRDEAVKQRDSVARQRDLAKKDKDEATAKLVESQRQLAEAHKALLNAQKNAGDVKKTDTEIQKQFAALRLARDASAAQVTELKNRVGELEDQVANLEYDLEKAAKATKQAVSIAEKIQTQFDEATSERDALTRKLTESESEASLLRKEVTDASSARDEQAKKAEELSTNIEELKKKNTALKKKNTTLLESEDRLSVEVKALRAANAEHEAEVKEIRQEIEKLTQEREAEIGEFSNKLDELRKAHDSQLTLAKHQHETALKERDAARQRVLDHETEFEEMQAALLAAKAVAEQLESQSSERDKHIQSLTQVVSTMEQSDKDYNLRLAEAERSAEVAKRELNENIQEVENARGSLLAAQKQIEFIIRERDTLKQQLSESAGNFDKQLKERRTEIGRLKMELEQALSNSGEHQKLAKRYEEHRLEMIEVSAQLENAQHTIKEMSASLAEARLMAKSSARPVTPHAAASGTRNVNIELAPVDHEVPLTPEVLAVLPATFAEPITDKSERSAIGAMRHCFQNFSRRPDDLSLINELASLSQSFAERALLSGQTVIHRVSSAFAALLQELYAVPEQLTPLIQRTINQTIEFLAALLKQRDLDGSIKLSTARVYAVDDDHSACEMISDGLNNVGLKTKTTQHPSAAVAELAGSRYDLIILDVHLPDLNGFELCSHIRNMALHADTPIIFLTGNDSQENRVESSLRGGNEFLPKPFNLQELALRSLTLIIKSQLKIS